MPPSFKHLLAPLGQYNMHASSHFFTHAVSDNDEALLPLSHGERPIVSSDSALDSGSDLASPKVPNELKTA